MTSNEGWIEHDGKAKPKAEEGTIFDLKFRGGFGYTAGKNIPWCWTHTSICNAYDIVAYRLHKIT